MIGADYIHRISPTTLRSANVSVVCRYLSYPSKLGKVIGKTEYDELVHSGITVILNWEWDFNDWLTGGGAGKSHGTEAVRQANALGYPKGWPIVGSCDFDITSKQWNASAEAYAIAFRDAVVNGGYSAGVYGPWDVLDWCAGIGYRYFWQSMSTLFSNGRNAHLNPHTDLWQRGYITIGGQVCDHSDIIQNVATVATVPIISEATRMTMIATLDNVHYYVCDGMTSRPIAKERIPDFVYLAGQGLCNLAHGKPGPEWADANIRLGWGEEAFGKVTTPPVVDVNTLAQGLQEYFKDHPMADTLTATEFHHALVELGTALTTEGNTNV